jgi:hypothetical protein
MMKGKLFIAFRWFGGVLKEAQSGSGVILQLSLLKMRLIPDESGSWEKWCQSWVVIGKEVATTGFSQCRGVVCAFLGIWPVFVVLPVLMWSGLWLWSGFGLSGSMALSDVDDLWTGLCLTTQHTYPCQVSSWMSYIAFLFLTGYLFSLNYPQIRSKVVRLVIDASKN